MTHKVNVLIELDDRRSFVNIDQASYATLEYLNAPQGVMSLVLTDNATIQKMNKDFMDVDQPTDVLSFPDGTTDLETGRVYFGDVIIAVPYAESQTSESGHTLEEELALLSIHGILHLFGFVHSDPDDKENMWSIQDIILKKLGFGIASPG